MLKALEVEEEDPNRAATFVKVGEGPVHEVENSITDSYSLFVHKV